MEHELVPESAELSKIASGKTADKALDRDLETRAMAGKNEDNEMWLKINFHQVYCIQSIVEFKKDGTSQFEWTCSQDDCDTCEPKDKCVDFRLEVYTEGEKSTISSLDADCKLGNTVKLEKIQLADNSLAVAEIAIVWKKGTVF